MPEMIPFGDDDADIIRFRAMSDDHLIVELQRQMAISVNSLVACAKMVYILEMERRRDLSHIPFRMMRHLRKIAYGAMHPGVLTHFGNHDSRLNAVARLPMPLQVRLVEGEKVPLCFVRDSGEIDQRLADPTLMTREEFQQVFASDHIRSREEQVAILQRGKESRKVILEKIGDFPVDPEFGIYVRGKLVSWADMEAALRFKRSRKNNS